jgi:hypothetical protein
VMLCCAAGSSGGEASHEFLLDFPDPPQTRLRRLNLWRRLLTSVGFVRGGA